MTQNKTKVFIIEEKPNPSTDLYILPLYQGESYQVSRFGFEEVAPQASLINSIVIFVRYLPTKWCQMLSKTSAAVSEINYFMDDDLLDWKATKGLGWRYRLKMYLQVTKYKAWLKNNNVGVWVSTDFLAKKYQKYSPRLVLPKPVVNVEPGVRVFYHGSITHQSEIDWLYPVVKEVLERNGNIYFEFIGDAKVNQLFRSLDRVTVVNLMSWQSYQWFIRQPGRAIGLVPLIDTPFNRARSYIKFFDITLAGAVGIYAENSECGRFVENNIDGLVLPMDQKAWVEAIIDLASSPDRRGEIMRSASLRLKSISSLDN